MSSNYNRCQIKIPKSVSLNNNKFKKMLLLRNNLIIFQINIGDMRTTVNIGQKILSIHHNNNRNARYKIIKSIMIWKFLFNIIKVKV